MSRNLIAVLFVIFVLSAGQSHAASAIKCSKGSCQSSFFFETQRVKERHTLTFDVNDGRIVSSSVCADHPYGSLVRRECRSAALDLFKEQCAKDKKGNSKRKMYCDAASRFSPIQ